MRVLMTVHKLPPESLGGTEVYTRGLARSLAAQGHTVTLFSPSPSLRAVTESVESDGVRLFRVPLPSARLTENPAAQFWHTVRDRTIEASFRTCLARAAPEVVHFQHVQGVSAQLIALARGAARIATLHDYWYFCANSQLVRPDRTPCDGPSPGCRNCVDCATARAELTPLRALRPLVAQPLAWRNQYLAHMASELDCMIAPSHFLRAQYVDQGFPAARIRVLENGTDLERIRNAELATTRIAAESGSPRPHFGFLGSLAWQKGVHILVDAFNRLDENAASLTIYGSGDAFPEYAAEVARASRHRNARFAGPIAYDKVGAVLAKMDALVVPSLWYENSPLVIQEARAAGVPAIVSRLGALAEKVEDGKTGRLFTAGDSEALAAVLQEVVDHPELLGEWRQHLTPPPSMEEHAAEIAGIYTEILQTGVRA